MRVIAREAAQKLDQQDNTAVPLTLILTSLPRFSVKDNGHG